MSIDPVSIRHLHAAPEGKQLRDQERMFQLLVSSVKDYGIFMLDPVGNIMTWNEGAQNIEGYTEAEIVGKHFSTFYTPDAVRSKHPQHELDVALSEGRYEEEGWRVRKDGTRFWANVLITPVYDNEEHVGFAKILRDLTERRNAQLKQEELWREQQIFATLVKSVRDYAIFMLDAEGNVMTWNEGAQRLKGYTSKEIIGQHFSKFYPQEMIDKRHPQYELEVAKRDGRYEEEGWRLRKDGSVFWANVVITALFDDGELIGFAKVTRDLTERKRAEEQKEQHAQLVEQTMDELQYLAYVMSHELQAPVSTIQRYGNLIAVRYKDRLGADAHEFFNKTDQATKLIARMVDDLWNYARVTRPDLKFEHVPLKAVAGDAAGEFKQQLQELDQIEIGNLPEIEAHRGQMNFLFKELIRNAIRYREPRPLRIWIDAEQKDDGWLISVKDNGKGIDSIYLSDAFKVYHRINNEIVPEATGMGLPICRKIVSQHGGNLSLSSAVGDGTTVEIYLPSGSRS